MPQRRPAHPAAPRFAAIALVATRVAGSYQALVAVLLVHLFVFAALPFTDFVEWNIWYNNTASIGILLLAILIQYGERHFATTVHLKLDELLVRGAGPRPGFAAIETASAEQFRAAEVAETRSVRSQLSSSSGESESHADASASAPPKTIR